MITRAEIENWFTYHDDPNKVSKYKAIREAAKYLAGIIVDNAPSGADQSAAIRLLRESVMTANAAIACEPPMGMGASGMNGEAHAQTASARYDPDEAIHHLENELKTHYQMRERLRSQREFKVG